MSDTAWVCGACGNEITDWVARDADDCCCPHCATPLDPALVRQAMLQVRIRGSIGFFILFLLVFGGIGALFSSDWRVLVLFAVAGSGLSLGGLIAYALWQAKAPKLGEPKPGDGTTAEEGRESQGIDPATAEAVRDLGTERPGK